MSRSYGRVTKSEIDLVSSGTDAGISEPTYERERIIWSCRGVRLSMSSLYEVEEEPVAQSLSCFRIDWISSIPIKVDING